MFIAFFVMSIFLFSAIASAETRTYEGVGEWTIVNETIEYANNQAKLDAERDVARQVYAYVEGNTITQDSMVEQDEAVVVTEGLMKIKDVKYRYSAMRDYILVTAIVTAEVDMEEAERIIHRAQKKKQSD